MNELQRLIEIANKEYDGHFTLLKFTTDWGCCFGTIDDLHVTSYKMAHGKTMNEAIRICIINRTDSYQITNEKMITITDKFGNTSKLFPKDKIKVIYKDGREIVGRYLGECSKYREYGHWYFSGEFHDMNDYCNYYYPNGKKKYLAIYEYDKYKTTHIDEDVISRIVVLKHRTTYK